MEDLSQAFIDVAHLMLTGMIFVFCFLGLLVIFIKVILSKLAIRFPDTTNLQPAHSGISLRSDDTASGLSETATSQSGLPGHENNQQKNSLSPHIVAAITSAIKQYRLQDASRKKQTSKEEE